ncbi:MAG: Mur ligase family protein [Clostridia bacterium]
MIIIGICGNEQTSHIIAILRKITGNMDIKTSIIESYDSHSSTPPASTLKGYINELDKNNIEIAVIKITSEKAWEGIYNNINFNILVYDSVENTSENIFDSKKTSDFRKVFELMGKESIAIVNNDDSTVLQLLKGCKMCVITYGLSSKVTITASSIDQDLQSSSMNYCLQRIITTFDKRDIEPQEFPIKISSTTDKEIYAILVAVTIAIICGIDIQAISQMIL